MATRAKSACRHPACPALLDAPGYCDKHTALHRKKSDERRGSASERGYNSKWQRAREAYLQEHPLCECDDCKRLSRTVAASVVDHIVAHKLKEAKDSGDPAAIARAQKLFWDRKNWQAMSKPCHDRKTARTDGGFGRKVPGGGQILPGS